MRALVHQFLEHSADRDPDAEFVVEAKARFTYGEVESEANRIAHLLLARGLEPGDRVALLARNSQLYVASYYGVLKARGVVVALSTASSPAMLAQFLTDSGARGLIVGPQLERLVHRAGSALTGIEWLISPHAERLDSVCAARVAWDTEASRVRPACGGVGDDVASIVYTSGTTGQPRGATLTHTNLVANTESIVGYLALGAADRALLVLPLSYVYGKSVLNTHARVGGCVVMENRFQYPSVALDTLEAERCTGLSGVPSTFAILLERSNLSERELAHLRYVTQAGGAMSPALTRRLMGALPRTQIFVMYGATEAAARLAYLPPDELGERVGSVGRAIDGVSLQVARPDGSECDADEVGELVARGPNIMRGYWNAPEETARVLRDGAYYTGDLARRDSEGFLYIVGRSRDMLKVGGHRIAAREIEDALAEHPAVHEAAVIGEPDELMGATLRAFVVWRDGLAATSDELARFLSARLPAFKVPKAWDFVDALPRNQAGKIVKARLGAVT